MDGSKDKITKLIKKSELALRFSLSLFFHFLYFFYTIQAFLKGTQVHSGTDTLGIAISSQTFFLETTIYFKYSFFFDIKVNIYINNIQTLFLFLPSYIYICLTN